MLNEILPQSDIYLLPTYSEAFGFAILEAMAYGIPVVATNVFAIPEILTHEGTGVLIDIKDFDTEKLFPGYLVSSIPNDFSEVINEQMLRSLRKLISSSGERQRLGTNGRREAMSKFGFQNRNNQMNAIYENAC
jgi:glycosyltransferase involved in cell wall biosynthesis